MKTTKFVIKLQRPVCRTPIKPVQKHKPVAQFDRKEKHKRTFSYFFNGDE
jgi:hypothetical protein